MTAIDVSQFTNKSSAQIVAYMHNQTAVPSLLVLWFASMIILFCAGYPSVSNKGKFLAIFGITAIASGLILIMLIFLPNVTYGFSNFLRSFFNF